MRLHRMSTPLALLAAPVLFCSPFLHTACQGATIFNNGAVNLISGASPDIEVQNGPGATSTIVNVVVGADIAEAPAMDPNEGRSIGLIEDSVLLFSGGTAQGNIEVGDSSIAQILGAAEVGGDVVAGGNSQLVISANAMISGEVAIEGNASGGFFGGEVDTFGVFGNATAVINGGSVDDDLDAGDDAVLTVIDIFVNDDVDAEGNGVMHLMGGVYDEDVEAAENSRINISGGQFVRIFSDGANLVANGGRVNVTGGVFGAAGAPSDGVMTAVAGGKLDFKDAEIAGAGDGVASGVRVEASILGEVNIENVVFNDLDVLAVTGAEVSLVDVTADALTIDLQAGSAFIDITEADSLSLVADLQSTALLRAGDFGSSSLRVLGGSTVQIRGTDFVVNGITFGGGKVPFVSGDIQATLTDGSSFSTLFTRSFSDGSMIVLIDVPEPTSLSVLGFIFAIGMVGRRSVA